jgi:hypothetical protein
MTKPKTNKYHQDDLDSGLQYVHIGDADGNEIDPSTIELDPDWLARMRGDPPMEKIVGVATGSALKKPKAK